MTKHLRDAIRVNRARGVVYAELTGGASRSLSRALIQLERAALPAAMWIDRCAVPFQAVSIPIVADDFFPMDDLPPADTPVRGAVAPQGVRQRLRDNLRFYRWSVRRSLRTAHFDAVANASFVLLEDLVDLEAEHACHFAMTRHLIESIGWGALGAMEWDARSGGATRRLSRSFLWLQLWSSRFGPQIDAAAQRVHVRGAGIVVNDVPSIPFVERYESVLAE